MTKQMILDLVTRIASGQQALDTLVSMLEPTAPAAMRAPRDEIRVSAPDVTLDEAPPAEQYRSAPSEHTIKQRVSGWFRAHPDQTIQVRDLHRQHFPTVVLATLYCVVAQLASDGVLSRVRLGHYRLRA